MILNCTEQALSLGGLVSSAPGIIKHLSCFGEAPCPALAPAPPLPLLLPPAPPLPLTKGSFIRNAFITSGLMLQIRPVRVS